MDNLILPETADVVTNSIPPEGDEYNARRQEELHAAVANKATMTRRMAEMIRINAPAEEITQVIEVIAQLDREIPHISKDLAVSVQGKNLTIFLDRMDVSLAKSADAMQQALDQGTVRVLASVQNSLDTMLESVRQVLGRLVKLEESVKFLEEGQAASNEEIKRFSTQVAGEVAELRSQIVALGLLAEKANILTEETNRLTGETNRLSEVSNHLALENAKIAERVAAIEAWQAKIEARAKREPDG